MAQVLAVNVQRWSISGVQVKALLCKWKQEKGLGKYLLCLNALCFEACTLLLLNFDSNWIK
jgi:hypothetical protein